MMESLWQDVRDAARSLGRAPGFTALVVLTLAGGIGANTAILSIVNGVLLRPLAYPRPAQLMYFTTRWESSRPVAVSVMEYLEFQQFNRSFANVGAFRLGEADVLIGESANRVRSAVVDAHLLNTLGLQPIEGRLFTDRETGGTSPSPLAVISYELWQSAFGAQPIVGHSVDVDGRRLEVVGVMARGADLMDNHTEIWLPLAFTQDERLGRNNHNHSVIGRLRDGVTPATAQTELDALIETWSARTGITPGQGHDGHVFRPLAAGTDGHILQMTPLADEILGRTGRAVWMLQAAVGLVLLIACANVANLLLARAETRRRELAVRTALGGSRGRLLRAAVTESVILSITGAALGVVLAQPGVAALVRLYPDGLPRLAEVTVDPTVVLASFTLATISGLLFGLASMIHAGTTTKEALASASHRSTVTARHHVRRALVVAEIALAVIVVAGAALLMRTVQNLAAVDAGFERSRLATFSITLPSPSFDLMGRVRAYQRVLDHLRAVPGVDQASAMTSLPLDRPFLGNQTEIANSAEADASIAPIEYQRVMSAFFETTGIPIVQGHGFQAADAASAGGVTVVNETLANTYWRGRNPIGQQLRPGGTMPWFTVIGVARDVKQTGVDQPVRPEAYVLVDQIATDSPTTWLAISPTTMNVVMRTTLPLAALAPTIARVVRELDPAVPVARLREMDDVFTQSIQRPRALAQLLTVFSALALVLACIGLYGVLSYSVASRTSEIGVRMAIGASPSDVLRLVVGEGMRVTSIGIAVGTLAAIAGTRAIQALLFGVTPTDLPTYAAVIAALVIVALLASLLPAIRAARLDPMTALRAE